MKISLFTPYLGFGIGDTHASLLSQDFDDWEWVIGLVAGDLLPDTMRQNPRIIVRELPSRYYRDTADRCVNGAAMTAGRCTGDVIVELPCGDVLLPAALSAIADAAATTPGGFYYSDFICVDYHNNQVALPEAFGWTTYPTEFYHRAYDAAEAFDATAQSLQQIGSAPYRLRAWSRSAFAMSGGLRFTSMPAALAGTSDTGHYPDRAVLECLLYDAVCRTYIGGAPFVRITQPLCLSRPMPGDADTIANGVTVMTQVAQQISNRHVYDMVDRWCDNSGLCKLDFSFGNPRTGYEHTSAVAWSHTGPTADTACPGTIGCVRIVDGLPYLGHAYVIDFWNRVYRWLAPGGWVVTSTPSTDGRGAFQNPAYRSYWNLNSFWCVTVAEQQRAVPGLMATFQNARVWESYPTEWHKQHQIAYVHADLIAVKGQRVPGLLEI